MKSPKNEILPLTSLRFFAAGLVFVEHLRMLPGIEWLRIPEALLGKVGVSTFFVLSGFIIAYSYWDKDWSQRFGANALGFYWSRFARIYPLHWLVFLLALPLGLNSNTARVSVADFPWLLTLTDRLWPGCGVMMQPVKVAWTLSCEFLFYLIAPFLLVVLKRCAKPLVPMAAIFVGYTAVIAAVSLLSPNLNWSAYIRVPEFLLGVCGYLIIPHLRLAQRGNLLICGGILWLVVSVSADAILPGQLPTLLHGGGALLVILGFAHVSGKLHRVLSHRWLVLLGHSSFSLYLLHDPLLRYTRVLCNILGVKFPGIWGIVVGSAIFAIVVCCSVLCFRYYENPTRLRLRAWFRKRRSTMNPSLLEAEAVSGSNVSSGSAAGS